MDTKHLTTNNCHHLLSMTSVFGAEVRHRSGGRGSKFKSNHTNRLVLLHCCFYFHFFFFSRTAPTYVRQLKEVVIVGFVKCGKGLVSSRLFLRRLTYCEGIVSQ